MLSFAPYGTRRMATGRAAPSTVARSSLYRGPAAVAERLGHCSVLAAGPFSVLSGPSPQPAP